MVFHTVNLYILNHEYTVYTSCGPYKENVRTSMYGWYSANSSLRTPTFHTVVHLLNAAEFRLQVLDPKK